VIIQKFKSYHFFFYEKESKIILKEAYEARFGSADPNMVLNLNSWEEREVANSIMRPNSIFRNIYMKNYGANSFEFLKNLKQYYKLILSHIS
jgi:hypothetical protein